LPFSSFQEQIESQALRYVLRLEIQAEFDGSEMGSTDEESHLEQVQEILAELDEDEGRELIEDVFQRHRFDLCNDCYHHFKNDPLGVATPKVKFSRN
jgi:hypothetical protein